MMEIRLWRKVIIARLAPGYKCYTWIGILLSTDLRIIGMINRFLRMQVRKAQINTIMEEKIKLRDKLADIALKWQASFGVAPSITSSISEYDAAMLVGMSEKEYSDYMRDKTAVAKGTDFVYRNIRYQVKANRPSGKKGSKVTMVPKASNYEWDRLIWILYDKNYVMQEAWEWHVEDYKMAFENKKRLSPEDYRKGHCLYYR